MSAKDKYPSPYPSGHEQYSFKMHVTHDNTLSFKIAHPKVEEVIFQKKRPEDQFNPEWLMTIHFGPVFSMDQAKEIGNTIKDDILDMLSLTLKTKINELKMVGSGLAPRIGERGIVHSVLPFSFEIVAHGRTGTWRLCDNNIREIQDGLLKIIRGKPRYLIRLFRYAINAEDPVIQFLFLYLILYQMCENQDEVDRMILGIAPNTPSSAKPTKKADQKKPKSPTETIFTRLRNEIGHGREVDPEVTRREIMIHLDEFKDIVHTTLKAMV